MDCSHVGGWVGKGLGWVPSYPAYPVKIAEAAALCIWVLLRNILFSLYPQSREAPEPATCVREGQPGGESGPHCCRSPQLFLP